MTDRSLPDATERDVHLTRTFDAPVAVVWKFWTDPALLAQWFGPHAVSVDPATVTVEPRPGGRWDLAMHDEHGVYPISASILEIVEHEYLEVVMSAETGIGEIDNLHLRVQFHDHGDRTRVTMLQGPFLPEQRDLTRDGWTESFEKLDVILAGGTE